MHYYYCCFKFNNPEVKIEIILNVYTINLLTSWIPRVHILIENWWCIFLLISEIMIIGTLDQTNYFSRNLFLNLVI